MKIKLLLALAVAMLSAGSITAQNETSPYSKFGYGILRDNATSAQRQMGGVGYAMQSGRQVNVMNPASYAMVDSLTFLFDMGIDASLYWRKDVSGNDRDFGGGIDYLTMLFPVSKQIGVSIGLLPYSSVGYSFGSDINNGIATHQGVGGLNQLYLGAGYTPFKNFSLGFNASYLFGTSYNDVYATTSSANQTLFEQVLEVKDFHLQFGLQYGINIGRKNKVTVGVTYSPSKTLLGKTYVIKQDISLDSKPDTIAPGVVGLKGKFSLPDTWGAGISYEWNSRFQAEVDVTYQNWAKAKYQQIENFSGTKLDNRWKVAGGLSYLPDPRGGYFRRTTYRVGGFYNRDYMMVEDNHVRDYGISCGFGFPTASSKTIVNLGFEYHNRQATPNPLLKEQYFNITLGVNFNGLWFLKTKLR
ncbi:MAG: hypothetical protein J6A20_00480 [Muribaculaceae bacterium]|nr:hypothetical protein [Muribaculaceae bacterium]